MHRRTNTNRELDNRQTMNANFRNTRMCGAQKSLPSMVEHLTASISAYKKAKSEETAAAAAAAEGQARVEAQNVAAAAAREEPARALDETAADLEHRALVESERRHLLGEFLKNKGCDDVSYKLIPARAHENDVHDRNLLDTGTPENKGTDAIGLHIPAICNESSCTTSSSFEPAKKVMEEQGPDVGSFGDEAHPHINRKSIKKITEWDRRVTQLRLIVPNDEAGGDYRNFINKDAELTFPNNQLGHQDCLIVAINGLFGRYVLLPIHFQAEPKPNIPLSPPGALMALRKVLDTHFRFVKCTNADGHRLQFGQVMQQTSGCFLVHMKCRKLRTQKQTSHYTSVNPDLGVITDSEFGKIRFTPGESNAAEHVSIVRRFNITQVPAVYIFQYKCHP